MLACCQILHIALFKQWGGGGGGGGGGGNKFEGQLQTSTCM